MTKMPKNVLFSNRWKLHYWTLLEKESMSKFSFHPFSVSQTKKRKMDVTWLVTWVENIINSIFFFIVNVMTHWYWNRGKNYFHAHMTILHIYLFMILYTSFNTNITFLHFSTGSRKLFLHPFLFSLSRKLCTLLVCAKALMASRDAQTAVRWRGGCKAPSYFLIWPGWLVGSLLIISHSILTNLIQEWTRLADCDNMLRKTLMRLLQMLFVFQTAAWKN